MKENVQLLSNPTNYAVIQLPGRQFPGVVFQGDSLHALVDLLQDVRRLVECNERDEALAELTGMTEQLSDVISHYKQVCHANNIELPFKLE